MGKTKNCIVQYLFGTRHYEECLMVFEKQNRKYLDCCGGWQSCSVQHAQCGDGVCFEGTESVNTQRAAQKHEFHKPLLRNRHPIDEDVEAAQLRLAPCDETRRDRTNRCGDIRLPRKTQRELEAIQPHSHTASECSEAFHKTCHFTID